MDFLAENKKKKKRVFGNLIKLKDVRDKSSFR